MNTSPKPWYKKWWAITVFILIAFILILATAFAFYVLEIVKNLNVAPSSQTLETNPEQLKLIEDYENNYWFGAANPIVTVVEFGDFACSYCLKSFPKIREISLKYKDQVKIVFRDFPVIAEHSVALALAARCAGEQGLFWPMHDKLFLNQGVAEENELLDLARQIGANVSRFSECFTNKKYLPDIEKDFSDGEKLGITGTPTWFINGYRIQGDIPYELFIQIIETLIK